MEQAIKKNRTKRIIKGDPALMFHQAECFFRARDMLSRHRDPEHRKYFGIPEAVNGALCLEILLKCLVTKQTGQVDDEHDLVELFARVDARLQKDIKLKYKTEIHRDPFHYQQQRAMMQQLGISLGAFDGVLASGRKSFVKFRYLYEYLTGNNPGVYCLDTIAWAVRAAIMENYSELVDQVQGQAMPYTELIKQMPPGPVQA